MNIGLRRLYHKRLLHHKRWLYHALRLLLGGVFLLSALLKLRTPEELAYTIRLVLDGWAGMLHFSVSAAPSQMWPFFAFVIIVGEILLGAAFILRIAVSAAALASSAVLSFFTAVLFLLMTFGHSCGCFGTGSGAVSAAEIFRNAFLIGCSFALRQMERTRRNAPTQNNTNDVYVPASQ